MCRQERRARSVPATCRTISTNHRRHPLARPGVGRRPVKENTMAKAKSTGSHSIAVGDESRIYTYDLDDNGQVINFKAADEATSKDEVLAQAIREGTNQ